MTWPNRSAADGRRKVAALFVYADGVYAGLDGVELWDELRDARRYAGPFPVVAHPPCDKWCALAPLNASRLPDYEVGDDGGCFAAALDAVRRFGGVLEHPAGSLAWPAHGLPKPQGRGWSSTLENPREWYCEVSQVAYGHKARKRTWLLYVGDEPPAPLRVDEPEAYGYVGGGGWRQKRRKVQPTSGTPRLQKRASSATPPDFRDALLALARQSVSERGEALPPCAPKAVEQDAGPSVAVL